GMVGAHQARFPAIRFISLHRFIALRRTRFVASRFIALRGRPGPAPCNAMKRKRIAGEEQAAGCACAVGAAGGSGAGRPAPFRRPRGSAAGGRAMASYRGHLTFSSALGVTYAGLAFGELNVPLPIAAVGGGLAALGGLLPDLDSDSGVPVRELFNL